MPYLIDKIKRLQDIKNIAINKEGVCLDNFYINSRNIMKFVCKNNHEFNSTGGRIMKGHWCMQCSGNKKLTLEKINEWANFKKLICVSDIYTGNKQKLKWKCLVCNFIILSSKNAIEKDFIICSNCKKMECIQKARIICENKGGICLSINYKHSHNEKLICKCVNDHTFEVTYNNLVNIGSWCPYCVHSNNLSEEICRSYFESMFDKKFIKIRPNWLKKENGYNLELDGYCQELNLAFEHNGTYHFKNIDTWGDRLENVQINDKFKIKNCNNNNTKLIIIPCLFKTTPINNLREFIIKQCNILNILIPFPNIKIDLSVSYNKKQFDKYKIVAESKGGKCLSENYLGVGEKLLWECDKNHQWLAVPYSIKRGHWCPECGIEKRKGTRNK